MKRTKKITLQIISLGLLVYLIANSFSLLDFVASKNNALTSFNKAEIDTMQNIDSVKIEAKHYLDINNHIHYDINKRNFTSFYILITILFLQLIILFSGDKCLTKNNGR